MTDKKPASETPKLTKTAYVLSLRPDMPAKEVVAKAKAEGLSLSEGHVYTIRSGSRKARPKTKQAPKTRKDGKTGKAAKGVGSKTSPPATMTKAGFVRSLPADMPAAMVVKAAKKAGIVMTTGSVYDTRRTGKRPAKRARTPVRPVQKTAPAPGRVPSAQAPKAVASASATSVTEQNFRRLVVTLGVARAAALLADVQRRLEMVIAGP